MYNLRVMNGTYVRRFILCVIIEEVFVFHVFVDAIGITQDAEVTQDAEDTQEMEVTQEMEET